MPAAVHSIAAAARTEEDVDTLHCNAIIAELKVQLADMREQRDAWQHLCDAQIRLVEAATDIHCVLEDANARAEGRAKLNKGWFK